MHYSKKADFVQEELGILAPSRSTLAFNSRLLSTVLELLALYDNFVLKYILKSYNFEHLDLSLCLLLHLAEVIKYISQFQINILNKSSCIVCNSFV